MSEENEANQVSKAEAADYVKTLGRDGSYLEIDMTKIGETLLGWIEEEISTPWPKQIVLKASRFDITDVKVMSAMRKVFDDIFSQDENRGMSLAQISFLFFKKIFEIGVLTLAENKKPLIKYGEYAEGIPAWPPPGGESISTVEARYKDLIERLGCNGHDGAIAEIESLRKKAGLEP